MAGELFEGPRQVAEGRRLAVLADDGLAVGLFAGGLVLAAGRDPECAFVASHETLDAQGAIDELAPVLRRGHGGSRAFVQAVEAVRGLQEDRPAIGRKPHGPLLFQRPRLPQQRRGHGHAAVGRRTRVEEAVFVRADPHVVGGGFGEAVVGGGLLGAGGEAGAGPLARRRIEAQDRRVTILLADEHAPGVEARVVEVFLVGIGRVRGH